jgi:hypothetical protein
VTFVTDEGFIWVYEFRVCVLIFKGEVLMSNEDYEISPEELFEILCGLEGFTPNDINIRLIPSSDPQDFPGISMSKESLPYVVTPFVNPVRRDNGTVQLSKAVEKPNSYGTLMEIFKAASLKNPIGEVASLIEQRTL